MTKVLKPFCFCGDLCFLKPLLFEAYSKITRSGQPDCRVSGALNAAQHVIPKISLWLPHEKIEETNWFLCEI